MSELAKTRCSVTGQEYEPSSFSDAVHSFIAADTTQEDEALRRVFSTPAAIFQWFNALLKELELHTVEAVGDHPLADALDRFQNKWLRIGIVLLDSQYPTEAKNTISRLYQVVRTIELEKRERFHKGTILWWLAKTYHEIGSSDEARNYFLLAMLEDVRSAPSNWRNLPPRDWLVNHLQVDAATVDSMGQTACSLLEGAPWDPREPELIWLHLKPQRRRVSRAPLGFIKSVAVEFLDKALDASPTTKEVGDRLEQFVSYLFAAEDGFELLGSSRSPDSQNDILIRNRHDDAAISSLGLHLIVECKNWTKAVNAAVVRQFASRLRVSKVKTGILISKRGVTGMKNRGKGTGGRAGMSKEYLLDATAILVLDESDITELAHGNVKLSTELLERFEGVKFDMW